MTAVGLMQLSLRYFAETGAPKAVIKDFFKQLMDGEEDKPKLSVVDRHLHIVGPDGKKIV